MKNWKYIEGAKSIRVGNSLSEKEKILLEIKDLKNERAGWIKYKELHPEEKSIDEKIKSYTKEISDLQDKMLKVGNDTPAEYAKRAPKIVGGNSLPEELEKDVEKKDKEKVDEIKKLEKTGNAREWEVKESDVIEYINGEPNATVIQRICAKHLGTYDTSGVQALLVDEKANKWAVVKRGANAKMKVGNAKDKNDKDLKVGDFVNVTGKKGKVTKIIGDVVEVFFDNSGTYYPDRTDRYYANQCTKIGNSKAGNVKSEYEILKQDPSKMHPLYKKAYEEEMKKLAREDEEFKKRFEREYGVKAKNESSDDKFAYVMREFDEGKLKTPDGKVVTDPAQAKAIAYSESKKTENGLARARNAIKK